MKATLLTQGDLLICLFETRGSVRKPERSAEISRGHSRMTNPSEGPNMKTNGEAQRFMVMAAQKIHGNQPEPAEGEASEGFRRCVK